MRNKKWKEKDNISEKQGLDNIEMQNMLLFTIRYKNNNNNKKCFFLLFD